MLKHIDIGGWNYSNVETPGLSVNGESVLYGLKKAKVRTPQVFLWATYIAFPLTQPQVAFSGNSYP